MPGRLQKRWTKITYHFCLHDPKIMVRSLDLFPVLRKRLGAVTSGESYIPNLERKEVIDMKNTMILSVIAVCLFVGALLFVEQNVTKAYAADVPSCPGCTLSCYIDNHENCRLNGIFCVEASGIYYFWIRTNPSGSWIRYTTRSASHVCEGDCYPYELSEPILIDCQGTYDWQLDTNPTNPAALPICEGTFVADGCD
jgi:hypothetical protein